MNGLCGTPMSKMQTCAVRTIAVMNAACGRLNLQRLTIKPRGSPWLL